MAANRAQGAYVSSFLTGFTFLVAGLVLIDIHDLEIVGTVLVLASLALLAFSVAGLRRIKNAEHKSQ
ncbi:MAG TPA: hypothetical protein VFC10_17945 [Terriglobia bacterium]|jgi:hypothetical protein|nr:hypothetical protein [Terriglobia bacterium]